VQLTEQPTTVGSIPRKIVHCASTEAATAAVGFLPVMAGYIFYGRWLDLFPQIEFSTWMWSSVDLKWYVVSAFTHQGAFSRSSSFLADSATKAICGVSIHCINEPGFWAILLASYLLYWLIVRLTGSVIGAAVGATLWLLSVPVLDAFAWQATMGDRLVTLFGLATVHAGLSAMRWVSRRATILRVATANVFVLAPAIVAYNSKEISWLLLPSLMLLAIALTDDWRLAPIIQRGSVLVAIAGYAIFRTIDTFVLLGESSGSQSLDFGGVPFHNAKLYIAYLTNHLYLGKVTKALLGITLAGMLFAVSRYRRAGREIRSQIQLMIWAALSLAGGLVICLFTPSPGPYLLLLPSTFLWIALVALWRSIPITHRVIRPLAGLGIIAALTTIMLSALSGSYSLYGMWCHGRITSDGPYQSSPVMCRSEPLSTS
jgi:hypothetical protein